jgi:hypothetical protein
MRAISISTLTSRSSPADDEAPRIADGDGT